MANTIHLIEVRLTSRRGQHFNRVETKHFVRDDKELAGCLLELEHNLNKAEEAFDELEIQP